MKHSLKITLLLLGMFLVTQFIGLYVINFYASPEHHVPLGIDETEEAQVQCEINSFSDFFSCTRFLPSVLISFVFAILILLLLTKFKAAIFIKIWFFVVLILALTIAFTAIIPAFKYSNIFIPLLAIPLAFIKVYRKNFFIHNSTELLVYPGISVVFMPILNFWSIIILLIFISVYDMWAVWHTGLMQKMAKYQINELNVFSGFFIPNISSKMKKKIKQMKKSRKNLKNIKVHVAILGGGDVIFPIIAAGIMLKTFGLTAALLTTAGATLGLAGLFFFAEKKKFYPAMPFITIGIFLGMFVNWLLL